MTDIHGGVHPELGRPRKDVVWMRCCQWCKLMEACSMKMRKCISYLIVRTSNMYNHYINVKFTAQKYSILTKAMTSDD